MILSRFFKGAKPRRFDYQSRYYDAAKEDLENRVKAAKRESENMENAGRMARLEKEFESIREKSYSFKKRETSKSRLRFILILFVITYLCYWLLTRF